MVMFLNKIINIYCVRWIYHRQQINSIGGVVMRCLFLTSAQRTVINPSAERSAFQMFLFFLSILLIILSIIFRYSIRPKIRILFPLKVDFRVDRFDPEPLGTFQTYDMSIMFAPLKSMRIFMVEL